jgi:hypothetical protein
VPAATVVSAALELAQHRQAATWRTNVTPAAGPSQAAVATPS